MAYKSTKARRVNTERSLKTWSQSHAPGFVICTPVRHPPCKRQLVTGASSVQHGPCRTTCAGRAPMLTHAGRGPAGGAGKSHDAGAPPLGHTSSTGEVVATSPALEKQVFGFLLRHVAVFP